METTLISVMHATSQARDARIPRNIHYNYIWRATTGLFGSTQKHAQGICSLSSLLPFIVTIVRKRLPEEVSIVSLSCPKNVGIVKKYSFADL